MATEISQDRAADALDRIESGERIDRILTTDELVWLNQRMQLRPAAYCYDPVRFLRTLDKMVRA